jgi:NADPH-dependent 2,4-dienoyl-CoA reductase/sulfur reductase-like enzyme
MHLPFGEDIIYYRTLRDYDQLRALTNEKQHFIMIGGGYIGSEVAAALAMNGKKVTMILLEDVINGAKFPRGLGEYVTQYYRDKGVEVMTEQKVQAVEAHSEHVFVRTRGINDDTTHEYEGDVAVAGLGIKPNVQLAEAAGLAVDNGITVDDYLHTGHPDIYAAGDVANVYRPLLDKRMRIEHEDNSNAMGRAAGRNMAGANEKFEYQPYFYSDMFELGYEAVGDLSPKYEMVEDWFEPYQKGVIYYLDGGRVRGVVLWNVWGKLDAARALMAEQGPFAAADLKGKITG